MSDTLQPPNVPLPPLPGAAPAASSGPGGLAIAALVCAMVGLCFPPLALVAIVLGILALRKQSSGIAITSIVIGVIGFFVVFIALLLGLLLPALAKARSTAQRVKTEAAARQVLMSLETFTFANGRPAADLVEAMDGLAIPTDGWGTALEFRKEPARFNEGGAGEGAAAATEVYFIWSAGADATWQTEDDFVAGAAVPGRWNDVIVDPVKYGYKSKP